MLLISSNTLPAAPSGPACVASAVRQAGHKVCIHASLFAEDPPAELAVRLGGFQPEVGNQRAVGHGDGAPGICGLMNFYLDLRYTTIVLTNSDQDCLAADESIKAVLLP